MSTATTTATVETLTAEVRVLQFGARQITLSVAKQLDEAQLENVDMIGRVRLGIKNRIGKDALSIIGRHKETGALVVVRNASAWRKVANWRTFVETGDEDNGVIVSYDSPGYYDHELKEHYYQLGVDGIPIEIAKTGTTKDNRYAEWLDRQYAWEDAHGTHVGFPEPPPATLPGGWSAPDDTREYIAREAREAHEVAAARDDLYKQALALPLIVLAGR